jgi:hypothetical protein
MSGRRRPRATYANVTATLALVFALGGTSYAALTITGENVSDGSLTGADLKDGSVGPADLAASQRNAVTAKKKKKKARPGPRGPAGPAGAQGSAGLAGTPGAVDGCTAGLLVRLGRICAGSPSTLDNWLNALHYCTNLGLRLPSLSEALALAKNFDVPGVAAAQTFWTNDNWLDTSDAGTSALAWDVSEEGSLDVDPTSASHRIVCVADPTNAL